LVGIIFPKMPVLSCLFLPTLQQLLQKLRSITRSSIDLNNVIENFNDTFGKVKGTIRIYITLMLNNLLWAYLMDFQVFVHKKAVI
jgi:hypothetical protein